MCVLGHVTLARIPVPAVNMSKALEMPGGRHCRERGSVKEVLLVL